MYKFNSALLSIILFGALLLPNVSFATSGACSAHGGVNCAASAGSLGNAVCNDGWQSSVSFYLTDECFNSSTCFLHATKDCDANMLGNITGLQNLYGMGGSSQATGEIQGCKDAHTLYLAGLAEYNSCVSTNATARQQSIQIQTQALAQSLQQSEDAVCQEPHGIYSYYDSSKNACACQSGYEVDPITSTCELPAAAAANRAIVCTNALGPNGYLRQFTVGLSSQTQCVCRDGFAQNTSGKCEDVRPARYITQKALDFAKSNQNCKTNPALSPTEVNECFTYESNPDTISWQIDSVQNDNQTGAAVLTTPTPSAPVQSPTDTSSKSTTPAMPKKSPTIPAATTVPTGQGSVELQAILKKYGYTPPVSSGQPAGADQKVEIKNASTVAATLAPSPAPVSNHWYEWLNPINWFSWF